MVGISPVETSDLRIWRGDQEQALGTEDSGQGLNGAMLISFTDMFDHLKTGDQVK